MNFAPNKLIYAISTLVLLNLFLRVILIGSAPFTDEGIYAANAYFFYSHFISGEADSILPNFGTLNFYPLLVSWVYSLSLEPFFALRLIDAIVSSGTIVALFFFLCRVSQNIFAAFITALLFSWSINDPIFIDAGFKNSIPLATGFLFIALFNIYSSTGRSDIIAGVCLAMAVLTREPFLSFVIVIIGFSFIVKQRRSWLKLCLSFAATGFTVSLIFVIFRGGVSGLESLIGAYNSFVGRGASIYDNVARFLPMVLENLSYLLPLVVIGFISVLAYKPLRTKNNLLLVLLATSLIAAILPEILLKPGYPYHYAQSLIGLAIIINFGVLFILRILPKMTLHKKLAQSLSVVVISAVMFYLSKSHLFNLAHGIREAAYFTPVMIYADWSSAVVNDSFYLKNAAIVKSKTTANDRILISGRLMGLYPLTKRLPPSYQLSDLTMLLYERRGNITESDIAQLIATPPKVLVASTRVLPYHDQYLALVNSLIKNYSNRQFIPKGLRSYGPFSSVIFTQ